MRALLAEKDAEIARLVLSTGEHITVRSEQHARIAELEALVREIVSEAVDHWQFANGEPSGWGTCKSCDTSWTAGGVEQHEKYCLIPKAQSLLNKTGEQS